MPKPYFILNIVFPIYLIVFEYLLRWMSHVNTSSFVGPAIAASGLSLLFGVVQPKKTAANSRKRQPRTRRRRSAFWYVKDGNLILLGWSAILIELLSWYFSCSLTMTLSEHDFYYKNLPLYLGIGNYLLTILLSYLKQLED